MQFWAGRLAGQHCDWIGVGFVKRWSRMLSCVLRAHAHARGDNGAAECSRLHHTRPAALDLACALANPRGEAGRSTAIIKVPGMVWGQPRLNVLWKPGLLKAADGLAFVGVTGHDTDVLRTRGAVWHEHGAFAQECLAVAAYPAQSRAVTTSWRGSRYGKGSRDDL